jgi:hypothetical protein
MAFHSFAKLPAELRLTIWMYALHTEACRFASGTVRNAPTEVFLRLCKKQTGTIIKVDPLPAIFRTCRESRYEAIKRAKARGILHELVERGSNKAFMLANLASTTIVFEVESSKDEASLSLSTMSLAPFLRCLQRATIARIHHIRFLEHKSRLAPGNNNARRFTIEIRQFTSLRTFQPVFDKLSPKEYKDAIDFNRWIFLDMLQGVGYFCSVAGARAKAWAYRWVSASWDAYGRGSIVEDGFGAEDDWIAGAVGEFRIELLRLGWDLLELDNGEV